MPRALTALAIVMTLSCGGGSGPSNPPSGGTPLPTPTPTPEPTPEPPTQTCALGYGQYLAQCDRDSPQFLNDVLGAIDEVVAEQPELFDLTQENGPGGYRVLDRDGYHQAVVDALAEDGFCSEFDGAFVKVKNTNSFSEDYDIMVSDGFIRRGDGSYRDTCHPASFPIDPQDAIARIRVSFFTMRCPDGVEVPGLNQDVLPVGCIGTVTATPKDANEEDVPAAIHGPNISWTLDQDAEFVFVEDVENVPFNKNVAGRELGHFSLCATVKGIEGCLHGEVIP